MTKLNMTKWFGSKYFQSSWLIENFPSHYNCFVDLFGGAANVLLQKPKSKVEIYNDINGDLVNLLRQVRNNYKEFYRKVQWMPYSREEFEYGNENYSKIDNELDRAVWFYFLTNAAFNGFSVGTNNTFSTSKKSPHSFHSKMRNLYKIKNRIKGVYIEQLDYKDCIRKYSNSDTFFYMDPPYLINNKADRDLYYAKDMNTEESQKEFLNRVLGIQGKVMISGYNSDMYNDTLKDWYKKEKEYVKPSSNKKDINGNIIRNKGIECIWMNYEPQKNLTKSKKISRLLK